MFFYIGLLLLLLALLGVVLLILRLRGIGRKPLSIRRLTRAAVVAALYVALCLGLQPFSYGAIQVRIAEALCLLPVFGSEYIAAVTMGCFLANLLGSVWQDAVFGTMATFLACLATYKLRGVRVRGLAWPASLPPVLCNALIVGPEIALLFGNGPATLPIIAGAIGSVAAGETISCCLLGTALVAWIEHNPALLSLLSCDGSRR